MTANKATLIRKKRFGTSFRDFAPPPGRRRRILRLFDGLRLQGSGGTFRSYGVFPFSSACFCGIIKKMDSDKAGRLFS